MAGKDNGTTAGGKRNGAVTLSDRYLKQALELRKLDEKRASIKKSMQLIEKDAADGKVHVSQTELPIDDDEPRPAA